MKMTAWSNERIINFITEIHDNPMLWDVETTMYKDRSAKKDAWAIVAKKFDISSEEAYKKFRSLRTYARNEEKRRKNGSAGSKPVKWFAFDAISFVFTRDTSNAGLDSENTTVEEIETQDMNNSADQEEVVDSDSMSSSYAYSKSRIPKKYKSVDPFLEKERNIVSEASEKRRNEFAGFGEHIANKLSKYDAHTSAHAQFKIMQILFDCDMGLYRNPDFSVHTQSSDNNNSAGAKISNTFPSQSVLQNSNSEHITMQNQTNSGAIGTNNNYKGLVELTIKNEIVDY